MLLQMTITDSCFWQNKVNITEGYFVCKRNPTNYGNVNSVTGYHYITLKQLSGEYKTMLHHRAIWMASNRQQIPKKMQICHKDDDVHNNRISNLFCDTASNNLKQSVKNRKSKHPNTRMGKKVCVQAIYPDGKTKDFLSMTAAARELNVSRPVIGKIISPAPLHKYYQYAYDRKGNRYKFVEIKLKDETLPHKGD